MPANRVRDIFIARIKQLMSQYEESNAIDHAPTKGAMREQFLKTFLREMLPPKFSPVSGFIADMYGHITPQLDMIFIDRSELPTVSLVHETVIVPYEIALLTVEVKSTITMDTLTQVMKQRETLQLLQSNLLGSAVLPPRQRPQRIPTIVMGFESEVGHASLEQWVAKTEETTYPIFICLVNKLAILPTFGGTAAHVKLEVTAPDDYSPLLTFIGAMYRQLYLVSVNNSTMSEQERDRFYASHYMWFWEGYLSDFIEHYSGLTTPG